VVGGHAAQRVGYLPEKHQLEVNYDLTKAKQWLFGQPLYLIYGSEHKLSDHVTAKTKIEWKDNATVNFSYLHKFTERMRFVYAEEIVLD